MDLKDIGCDNIYYIHVSFKGLYEDGNELWGIGRILPLTSYSPLIIK
jgi:hypothetical protein